MKKKMFSFLLIISMALTWIGGIAQASENGRNSGGTTQEDHIEITGFLAAIDPPDINAVLITTAEELANIEEGHFVLGADIDLATYNNGNWSPIIPTGDIILDGQGHSISYKNCGNDSNWLFGDYSGCSLTIKNLGVEDINCGGIVNACRTQTEHYNAIEQQLNIKNCFACGTTNSGLLVGTIDSHGYLSYGSPYKSRLIVQISDCYVKGGGETCSGGFIGFCLSTSSGESGLCTLIVNISDSVSYVKATTKGGSHVGGFIGDLDDYNSFSYLRFSNCEYRGEIRSMVDESTRPSSIGGMVGYSTGFPIIFDNCTVDGQFYPSGNETIGIFVGNSYSYKSYSWPFFEFASKCYYYGDYPLANVSGNPSDEFYIANLQNAVKLNKEPDDVDPVDPSDDTASSVYFFSGWDPITRSISFDEQLSPYYLAASIDAVSVDALVGKYVLATVTTNPDNVLEVVNLQPVESSFGLVSSSGDQIITINGTEYLVSDNYSYLERYVGNEVLFHTYDGTIFGITPLQEKGGTLEHYDSGTGILTIDQKQYSIPYFVNISSDNVVTCLLQKVKFACDNLNHIYRIELYDNGEENNPVPDFNVDIYRANWMQNSIPAVENINRVLRDETPSAELVSNLQETGFDEAIVAWNAFDQISSALDDPTALAEFAAEPKDMYAAIILNALEASVSYDIVDSKIEDTYKEIGKLISTIHDSMKVEWNIDIYNSTAFKNLSGEQRDQVVEETKSWFKENFSKDAAGLEFINQMFNGVTKGFDTIGSIEDWCERIVSCYIVADTNEYLKAVLRQVYKDSLQGNNLYLKLALADCVEIMDSSAEKLMLKLINDEITVIGLKAGRYVIKECWSQVKDFIVMEFPAIAVFQQAYKNAKYASNLLFSTDDTIEQYLNMVAVSDIETLVGSSVAKLNREFNQQKTVSTAATYLTGMDFVFTLRDIDTQKAHGFADVLDNSWLNKIIEFLSGKENFTDVKSYYRNRQVWYNIEHEKFLAGWVDYLEEDYPNTGLYAYYQHLLDESDKRRLTKEFVAACPIDVYVYDQSGELAASIVDGRVFCFGDVMIALIDDTKVVRFYDNQDYRIKYVGTSAGEMDITVTEFNTDGEVVRTVNYYDVTLTDGKIYTIDADDTILNTTPYQLKDESTGKIVDYDYDSLLAKDSIKHAVSIQSGSMIQNGEILLSTEAVAGEKIEIISYVPERSTFDYWVSSNGDSIFADHTATSTTFIMPDEDIVIKAVIHGSSVIPSVYTITFDSNGGMTSATTITTGIDGKLPTLPTVTRNSFTFTGWYTSPTGGEQITTDTIFSSDTTVYAHWAYNNDDTGDNTPSDSGNGWGSNSNSGSANGNGIPHSLTLPSSVTGGKVTVSPQSAKKGDTVTITATPDSGYEIAALAATDSKGNELELTNKGNGKYTFVMPSGKVTVDVIFQPIELPADSSAPDWVNPFLDVSTSAWYYNAVRFASQSDLMNGVTATQFAPDAKLSRAQLAQILYNKEGTPVVSGGSPFTDVAAGTWYTNAVAWASADGIVGGYGDGRFGPNDNITREQLAVMLWRYAEEPATSVELTFSDASQISCFARPAICWAVENGILNGKGGNILDPKGFATRAEVAQMLKNYLDK